MKQENIGVAYDTLERLTLGAAWRMGNLEMSVQEVKKKLLSVWNAQIYKWKE